MATLRAVQDLSPAFPWFEFPWPSRWTWLYLGSGLGLYCIYTRLRYADTLKERRHQRERVRARQMRITAAACADPELKCIYDVVAGTIAKEREVAVSWRMQVQGCACLTPMEDLHSSPVSDPAVLWLQSRNYHPRYICAAASLPGEIELVASGQVRYALSPGWVGPALGELACVCMSLWVEGEATVTSRNSQDLAELLDIEVDSSTRIRVGCIDPALAEAIASDCVEPVLLPQATCINLLAAAHCFTHVKEASQQRIWKSLITPPSRILLLWHILLPDLTYSSAFQTLAFSLRSFQLLCAQSKVTTFCFKSEHGAGLTRPGLCLGSVQLQTPGRVSILGRPTSCLAALAALERKLLG